MFNVRVPPDLAVQVRVAAVQRQMTVQAFVQCALARAVSGKQRCS